MLVRLIGQGFFGFITNYENILYTLSTIGGAAYIIYTGGEASAISAFMALKVYKIVMRSGYYQTFNQLIDSIIYTLAVVMSYCAIMILFIYIFSLLGMQFFAGKLKFGPDGSYDPVHGKIPR
jgi:Ion transport protein